MRSILQRVVLGFSLSCLAACSAGPNGPNGPNDPSPDPNVPSTDPNAPPSCGVNPQPSTGDTATVAADGTVVFNPIQVGSTATFAIPVRESADTDETIVAASTSGAFKVLSPTPIYVPRGETVTVEVSFTPVASGNTTADLVLGTAKMGNSHVSLVGTGL